MQTKPRFLLLLLVGGVTGNLLSAAAHIVDFGVGASTCLFALLPAMCVQYYQSGAPRSSMVLFAVTMAVTVINGILFTGGTGIDAWGHLGGLLAGAGLSVLMAPISSASIRAVALVALLALWVALGLTLALRSLGPCDIDPSACAHICDY